MPFKRQFGYIFTDNLHGTSQATTIAHELGHGAFRLRHTFSSEDFVASERSTDNLMDYNNGTHLMKHQWDYIHDPENMIGWMQDDEEAEYGIPCFGIFDNCDDVLKMLENVRDSRLGGRDVLVKSSSKEDISYTAKNVNVDGVDYEQIRIIILKNLKPRNAVKVFEYEEYDQEFFAADGAVDRQTGFVFKKENKILAKILVTDHYNKMTEKIKSLRKYLFGEKEENIIAEIENIFKENIELSPDKIKEVREGIKKIEDEDKKAELYVQLQKKVKYRSQRDNEAPATDEDIANNAWMTTYNITTAGDIMCNLTSQAMCLEYLGIKPPCNSCPSSCNTYSQFEDYLECVRVDKEFDHRTKSNTREQLTNLFNGITFIIEEVQSSDRDEIIKILKPYLKNGCSILISSFGHIVRLQDITEEGLVVDDPYGKVVKFSASGVTAKYKKDGNDYRNDKDFTTEEGNNNIWKWLDVKNYVEIKYAEIYCSE